MTHYTKIFLPLFSKTKEVFFKGYIAVKDNSTEIFITKFSSDDFLFKEKNKPEKNIIYGHYYSSSINKIIHIENNYLVIDDHVTLQVKKCIINGEPLNPCDQVIILLYDYHKVNGSETIADSGNDFISELKYYLQRDVESSRNVCKYNALCQCPTWITSSMFMKHIFNYINLTYWLFIAAKRRHKISIQQGNLIFALIVDVILGYIILELMIFDQTEVATLLLGALEKLVNLMYSLLKWLMGAPAGLKLNNAFNKMLGKYFLYHVELWWLFLEVSSAKLDLILHLYQYVGYMGFTFQAAIISDMICLATFHSYCIYVYAARLFSIQISGLIALLRLFVGRKYNPLRNGIDSCEYTNQELFVGTVAFTILLLLLPTTIMYYIVFTMFRILSLMVQYVLAKLIYIIQSTPFYVYILWLSGSSKIGGKVFIEELTPPDSSTIILNLKLLNKSIKYLTMKFNPPVDMLKDIEWTNVVKNIVTGKQII